MLRSTYLNLIEGVLAFSCFFSSTQSCISFLSFSSTAFFHLFFYTWSCISFFLFCSSRGLCGLVFLSFPRFFYIFSSFYLFFNSWSCIFSFPTVLLLFFSLLQHMVLYSFFSFGSSTFFPIFSSTCGLVAFFCFQLSCCFLMFFSFSLDTVTLSFPLPLSLPRTHELFALYFWVVQLSIYFSFFLLGRLFFFRFFCFFHCIYMTQISLN